MKVTIIGTGYVGLVTGTCLAEIGNEVTCVDIDQAKVARMQAGEIPIYEPGLEELFSRNLQAGRLQVTTNLADGTKKADVIFLALPTPPGVDGSADVSAIMSVADQLGALLKKYTVIVDKSTVPVGTAEAVAARVGKHAKVTFDVVSNPEFLREGFAVEDFMRPDRVVIGTSSTTAQKLMQQLYRPLVDDDRPLLLMDARSAEITKYAANSFLITKISFINEIANVCERVGANIDDVRQAVGADERIGHRFLHAGIGYGGSCFPKDVQALIKTAEQHGYNFKLLKAAMTVNAHQQQLLVEKLKQHFDSKLHGKTFAVWGLAFKPDTDDIREAPALTIIDSLLEAGAQITAFDPEAGDRVREHYKAQPRVKVVSDKYQATTGADALLIATEWAEFLAPDFALLKKSLKQPLIFDGRNIYQPADMQARGFLYISIGRPS